MAEEENHRHRQRRRLFLSFFLRQTCVVCIGFPGALLALNLTSRVRHEFATAAAKLSMWKSLRTTARASPVRKARASRRSGRFTGFQIFFCTLFFEIVTLFPITTAALRCPVPHPASRIRHRPFLPASIFMRSLSITGRGTKSVQHPKKEIMDFDLTTVKRFVERSPRIVLRILYPQTLCAAASYSTGQSPLKQFSSAGRETRHSPGNTFKPYYTICSIRIESLPAVV